MFKDRSDAGRQLAEKLKDYRGRKEVLVLALPRGGVVTGMEIARAIGAPLDVLIVRKLGFPGQEELAVGAISETDAVVYNQRVISYGVSDKYIEEAIATQKKEIRRRVNLYRGGNSLGNLDGKTIILVDDGVATGATMKAAIATLKQEKIKKLVVATPVAPPSTADEFRADADKFICLHTPDDFMSVGSYYQDFTQVTDDEVAEILKEFAVLSGR